MGITLNIYEDGSRPRNPEENWVFQLGFMRDRACRILATSLAVDPAATYYALGFYRKHAELRHELGTPTAEERIQAGDLPDVLEEARRYGAVRPQFWHPDDP